MRDSEQKRRQLATFRHRGELVRLAKEWHVPFLPQVRWLPQGQRAAISVALSGRNVAMRFVLCLGHRVAHRVRVPLFSK